MGVFEHSAVFEVGSDASDAKGVAGNQHVVSGSNESPGVWSKYFRFPAQISFGWTASPSQADYHRLITKHWT